MKIGTTLDQIDLGSMALPEFQRGYVWNRDQVRGLMDALYRKHPVGSLLVWITRTEHAHARGDGTLAPGTVKLLLDGQQRITSLYGIIRGKPPPFFDGNAQAFTGLYFHLEDEVFEFYAPLKMQANPLWINVTDLMQIGAGEAIKRLLAIPTFHPHLAIYINRLNAIDAIKEIDLHIEEVTGEEKTVDVVVDIFNRVNSSGTKLSKGDLALAKICAEWPEAREAMKVRLEKWRKAGFHFRLEWFLRCITTVLTGEAFFSALRDIDPETFRKGLQRAEDAVDRLLTIIGSRLGLDHDQVLGSRYSFPLLAHYLASRGGHLADYRERDKLLYWYVHTFLWGRYAGSTETILNQDLALIANSDGGLDQLINQFRQQRGDLRLHPNDFMGWSRGARFYPLLYLLIRVCQAKDWETGVELSSNLLGRLSRLQIHHIFPKALLYQHRYSKAEANALANLTFLTQETNLLVSNRHPAEYLEACVRKHPGAVESHWIPMDRYLWNVERYRDFLAARRELLAQAANTFFESLLAGTIPESTLTPGRIESAEEEQAIQACQDWVVQQSLPRGEEQYELLDPATGEPLAIFDLAWPQGLQEGYSQPVALLLDEGQEVEEVANRAGYRYFTDVESFRTYVLHEILAADDVGP